MIVFDRCWPGAVGPRDACGVGVGSRIDNDLIIRTFILAKRKYTVLSHSPY